MKIEKITRRIKIGCIDIFGGYDKKQAEQLNILAAALYKECINNMDWDDLVGIFNQLYAGYMGWADETYNDEERKWWFE